MNEHLLLLEDDDVLRQHLGRKLEKHHYQVICCATLEQARQAITDKTMIDVAVLDQNGDVLSLERGDLLEVADEASQATLAAELASLRAKANEEMLPESQ